MDEEYRCKFFQEWCPHYSLYEGHKIPCIKEKDHNNDCVSSLSEIRKHFIEGKKACIQNNCGEEPMDDRAKHCRRCGTEESETWSKCCPRHTSEEGRDVVCEKCVVELHPPEVVEHNIFADKENYCE